MVQVWWSNCHGSVAESSKVSKHECLFIILYLVFGYNHVVWRYDHRRD